MSYNSDNVYLLLQERKEYDLIKFSIIIPVYNVEKYLPKCIESIINQTYSNLEIICINDGSSDNSKPILEDYSQKDSRIKVINKENEGVSTARNIGIEIATGDYFLFVDADDFIEPDACSILYNEISLNENDLIFFNHFAVTTNTKREVSLIKDKHKIYTLDYFLTNASMWGCCYKTFYIKSNKIQFPSNISVSEDQIFKIFALLKKPRIGVIDKPLYNYICFRNDSVTKDYKRGILENIRGFEYIKSTEIYQNSSNEIKLLILDNWSKLIFGMWSAIPFAKMNNILNEYTTEFLKNYKNFKKCDYKNLLGYKRLKYKFLIKFLKEIRDFYFSIIYRKNNYE